MGGMGIGKETDKKTITVQTHTMSDDLSAVRNNKAGLQGKGTTCTREEDYNFTWNCNKRNIVN